MTAYVIVETDITDPERYEQYKAATPAAGPRTGTHIGVAQSAT